MLWVTGSPSIPQRTSPGRGVFLQSGLVTVVERGTEVQKRKGNRGAVLLTGRAQVLKCLQNAGCSHPIQWPWPLKPFCLLPSAVGRKAGLVPRTHSPCSLFQLSPSGCLPGPVLVPSQGQVGAHCPWWAKLGRRSWLSSFSVVAGREGAWRPGWGLCPLGFPPLHR